MVLDIVTDPDGFFEREAQNPGWIGPIVVIALVGLVGILAQIPLYQAISSSLPEEVASIVLVIQIVGAIVGFVFTFVYWLIVGVLLYVAATVAFDAEGELWSVVKLAGWGFVPNIFGSIISALVFYSVFSGQQFPDDPEQTQLMISQLQSDPLFMLTTVASVVLLLWSGLLWAFAVRHSLDLTMRRSVLSAAVPVGLALLFQLGSMALSRVGGF